MEYKTVVAAIVTGELDNNLLDLISHINNRRDVVARHMAYTVQVGDTVTLYNIRPQHLNGARATVLAVNRTTVTVKLEKGKDKPFAPPSRVPLKCCQLVKG